MAHLSPFRPNASRREKAYTVGTLSWIAATCLGGVYHYFKGIHFGLEPDIVPFIVGLALLCGFFHWLPLYRDRHPSNKILSHSLLVRAGIHGALFLASFSLTLGTFTWLLGPAFTTSFGTSMSGEFVVTEKSSGLPDRRSCNHFVRLRDKDSRWTTKVCLDKQFWETTRVGESFHGTGHRSFVGRTLEEVHRPGS
jgi:hypothetical protein